MREVSAATVERQAAFVREHASFVQGTSGNRSGLSAASLRFAQRLRLRLRRRRAPSVLRTHSARPGRLAPGSNPDLCTPAPRATERRTARRATLAHVPWSAGVGLLRRDRCEARRRGIRPFATVAVKPLHASVRTYRGQRSCLRAVAVGAGGRSISHVRFLWTRLPGMKTLNAPTLPTVKAETQLG